MDKRLEELERNVQFLSLEVDKLMQKRQRQDGYLNDVDKDRLEDLQRKIAARQKTDDEDSREWTSDHNLLYTLLCISFFADQEIDETEKEVIFNSYNKFIDGVTDQSFNIDFGMTTTKFIDLKSESSRQAYYDYSLLAIKEDKQFNRKDLVKVINAYVDIANADDFIHEKEVTLIQHAINIWDLKLNINKPKSGKKLEIER